MIQPKKLMLASMMMLASLFTFSQSDFCASATSYGTLCAPVSGTNAGSTMNSGGDDSYAPADICALSVENTVWYTFTAPIADTYTINFDVGACASGFGLQTGVLTGPCGGPYTSLNCGYAGSGTAGNSYTVVLTAGQQVYIVIDGDGGDSCPFDLTISGAIGCCAADAGTVTVLVDGLPAASPIDLCSGVNCITLTSNNDFVLPTPQPGELSELMYALYTCPPTTGDPATDPCYSGSLWSGQDFADCDPSTYGLTGTWYFVPITADDGDNGGDPNGVIHYDQNGDGCFALGTPIQINYNPVENAAFNYGAASYCANGSDPTPTITGDPLGTFSSLPAGLSINPATGLIDVSASTPGGYTVTYTTNGPCPVFTSVAVTIDPQPTLIITDPAAVCTPGTVDLTVAAVTAGSDAGTLTYWTDLAATIALGTPGAVGTGTYYIQLVDGNGCSVVQAVNATVTATPNLVITDPIPVCTPSTVDLTAAAVTAGSDPGVLSYWTDLAATIPLGTPASVGTGTYYIQLDLGGGCLTVEAVNAVVNPLPTLTITDPAAVCSPATVDLTAAAVTAGSDAGTLTYWTDLAATIALGTPGAVGTGTYYIQLVDGNGCSVVQAVNAVVNPLPTLTITDPAAVCTPGTVDLTAAAVTAGSDAGALTYWLDLAATIVNPVPNAVSGTGTYYIQLVDGNGCSVVQPVNVTINPLPTLVITDPAAVCSPSTVDLTAAAVTAGSDAGTLTYWTDVAATVALGTPNAVGTGTYYIQLVDGNGCSVVQAVNSVVNPLPTLIITDPAAVCSPATVDLTAAAVTAGSDAGTLTYWTDMVATIALGTPNAVGTGTYFIQLVDGNGCSVVQAVNAVVNPLPTLTITDPAAVCSPATVDLTAAAVTAGSDAGTLTYWTDVAATVALGTPNAVGTGTYYIQLVDGNGCSIVQAVNAVVNPLPTLTITDPAAVCAPGTVDLTAAAVTAGSDAGTLTYWTDLAATIALGTPNAVGTGTYYIQLVDGNGCSVVQAVNATVTGVPTLIITDPAAVCSPGTVDITAAAVTAGSDAGTLTYWTDLAATIALGTPNAVGTGTYYIQLEIGGGCTTVEPVNVVVNPLPTLTITDPTAVCTPGTVDLTAAAVTAGSDAGTLTYWTDAGATVGLGTPGAVGTGTYYIQLVDGNGCSVVQAVNSVVNPLPTLTITDPAAVCSPATVDLTAAAVTAGSDAGTLTYWTDMVATIALGTPNAVGTGTNYIQLVDGNGCSVVQAVNAIVNPLPTLTITDPAAVCSPGTVDITAAAVTAGSDPGTLTYWTDMAATVALGTPNAVGTGTYYIQLVDGNGCSVVQAVAVTVNPLPNLIITDPAAVCASGTEDITAAAITVGSDAGTLTYWQDAAATIPEATPTTVGSGTYYIMLQDGNGCTSVEPVTVSINPVPNATATNDGPICAGSTLTLNETAGDAVSWFWTTSGGSIITNNTDQSPTVSGANDGETYTVLITDANGCTNTALTSISVIPQPVIDPIADVTACDSYTLGAITGTNLSGNEAYYDSPQLSGGTQITNLTILGSQTIWAYDGNGTCSDEISFVVTVNPLPTMNSLTGSSSYCTGDPVADILVGVNGAPDWTINYTLDGVAQTATGTSSPVSLGSSPGVYVLVDITDANCSNTLTGTQTIIVNTYPPAPTAGTDQTYCTGVFFDDMIASGTGGTYTWYSDSMLTDVLGTGTTLLPDDVVGTTTYYVTETTNDCEGPWSPVIITVDVCDISVPTAFTPDGDMINDIWEILHLDLTYPNNEVYVYNRWGNMLYSSDQGAYSLRPWDGTYKGEALPVGSYYYVINFNDENAEEDSATGTVSIILNK